MHYCEKIGLIYLLQNWQCKITSIPVKPTVGLNRAKTCTYIVESTLNKIDVQIGYGLSVQTYNI